MYVDVPDCRGCTQAYSWASSHALAAHFFFYGFGIVLFTGRNGLLISVRIHGFCRSHVGGGAAAFLVHIENFQGRCARDGAHGCDPRDHCARISFGVWRLKVICHALAGLPGYAATTCGLDDCRSQSREVVFCDKPNTPRDVRLVLRVWR